jgi:asparagine synthase (glutamine-hydrolysing)
MAGAMAFRGPDRLDLRVEGGAGFAHALLRTDPGAPDERQPLTFDGRTWIVADARIDAQDGLRRALVARDRTGAERCSDAGLILHAWHAWGEDCVSHLLGDFAFAIWDGERRRLYCARDHFGVKTLFHARVGNAIVFANTLDSVRAHGGVSQALDDLAIADFLLFEESLEPGSTAFAAIRRLPPGARLASSLARSEASAYWEPPRDIEVACRRAGDYAERLRELLQAAVSDRLRTPRVAIQMSGGLDSTAVAALARRALAGRQRPFDLHAHAIVYDRLVPDDERRHAGIAARALGIPLHCHAGDDRGLYERFDAYQARFPLPYHAPDLIVGFDCLRAASAHARVLLTGYDGDTILEESPRPYLRSLLREGRYARALVGAARHALSRRRALPRARAPVSATSEPRFPPWLEPGLVARLGLRERWRQYHARAPEAHALRPSAHRFLALIRGTSSFFDQYEAGVTGLPLECRHPFLDLRVVEFCLSLPPEPWCVRKRALREAMRGLLPDEIRLRPKTPLAGWPGGILLARGDASWVNRFAASSTLDRFVERRSIPAVGGADRPLEDWMHLRPLTLNLWLQHLQPATQRELHHEIA